MTNLPLFEDLTAEELAALCDVLRRRTVRAGRDLLQCGMVSQDVSIVLQGTVKVYVPTDQGDEVVLSLLGRGEVLGEISALDGLDHSASIVTIEDTDFLTIGAKEFCHCLRTMPGLSFNLLCVFARRLRRITDQAASLAVLSVPNRLARQLLLFAHEYGVTEADESIRIPMRLTQTDLAGLVGTSREGVNRALSGFRRQKLIAVSPDCHITILDRKALRQRGV